MIYSAKYFSREILFLICWVMRARCTFSADILQSMRFWCTAHASNITRMFDETRTAKFGPADRVNETSERIQVKYINEQKSIFHVRKIRSFNKNILSTGNFSVANCLLVRNKPDRVPNMLVLNRKNQFNNCND